MDISLRLRIAISGSCFAGADTQAAAHIHRGIEIKRVLFIILNPISYKSNI